MSSFQVTSGTFSSTTDYTILQSLSEEIDSLELPSRLSTSWRKFSHSSKRLSGFVTDVAIIPAMNTTSAISAILMDEYLSPEDREARAKTLQMAARIEHLYQTDEGFRRWYDEGIDEVEAGHFVTFSEDGWKEE